ncbi:ABC transporter permease [Paenibacillus ginsengarvi]|uniref:Uncharacterized protein n=1 Tax=Paenibacillus ginsengarvi TaxID=400777 RepID=A0A3B0AVZ1_9BACL|nr:hypothetical protein [Paenibacillus ginsengarvi]RKN64434.1 hypothetical protein D7M11_33790 [Paenibacillus ginsengarvi]
MASLWRHIGYEWKMMARSAMLWVIIILFVGVVLLFSIGGMYTAYRNSGYTAVLSSSYLFFLYFMGMMMAVDSSRREQIEATDVLRGTLPYSSARWLFGRWLALLLPFTLLSWYPLFLFISGMFPFIAVPGVSAGIIYLASLAVPMWFVVSVGFFIGDRIPGRWSYLVAILFYLVFAYGIHLWIMGRPSAGIALFDLAGYVHLFEGSDFSLFWGFYTDSQHWLHRLFYLAIAIVILAATLMRHSRGRRERGVPYYAAAGVIALLLVVVIPWMYFAAAERRYIAASQVQEDYARFAGAVNTSTNITPVSYRMKIGFGSSGTLRVTADIEFQADSTSKPNHRFTGMSEIELYLDRLFTVKQVRLDGEQVDWEEGSIPGAIKVRAQIPAESAYLLTVEYEGAVVQWSTAKGMYGGDKVVRRAYASTRDLLLPANMIWYPMTAAQLRKQGDLQQMNFNQLPQPVRTNGPAIQYELEIASKSPMPIVCSDSTDRSSTKQGSNWITMIKAQSRDSLTLIGGPFELVQASGERSEVMLIASTLADRSVARQTAANTAKLLDRTYAFMDRTRELHGLPINMPDKVTLVPIHTGQSLLYIKDPYQQLYAAKATTHIQNGWLEVDESYPSGFEASEWLLLWQWLESLQIEDTINAPMKEFYHLLKEYVMSDTEPPIHREARGMMFRYERIYNHLGREQFERFMWDFYRRLAEIGSQFGLIDRSPDTKRETQREIDLQILQYLISQEGSR